jgi:hypothetical protein
MRGTAVAAVLCVAAATAANARADGTPSLRFTDLAPVEVKGARFLPGEQVRVVLRAGEAKRVRVVRVSSGGIFTVGFGTLLRKDRCSGDITIVATGTKGNRAVYKLPVMACIPESPTRQSA